MLYLQQCFIKNRAFLAVCRKFVSMFPIIPESDFPGSALNFIHGEQRTGSGDKFSIYESATGDLLAECSESNENDINIAVNSGQQAFTQWAGMPGLERGRILQKAAGIITENLEKIAYWEVRDNGKPIYEARLDIAGCADWFQYYGSIAATSLNGQHTPSNGFNFAYTRREPLGLCAGIGAWNYPFQTATWKVAPALACGNSFIYKPSPLTPITAVILARILKVAGLPDGVFNVVQGAASTGELLCAHPAVRKISFTGSVPTGQKIMQSCATGGLKPVTLELGGKSPLIIFEDADLENSVSGAMMANFFTQGEVCSNASRVFVHKSLINEFTEKLLKRVKAMRIGDPMDGDTKVGATISKEHAEKVLGFISRAEKESAKILYGGQRIQLSGDLSGGYFLSPCLMTDISEQMEIYRNEVFGSVLLIIPFDQEEEVLKMANDSGLGLAAGLFTRNLSRAHRISSRLEAGTVYINSYNDVAPQMPFGGYKMSGIGRENGLAVIEHYTQLKSIFVNCDQGKLEAPF